LLRQKHRALKLHGLKRKKKVFTFFGAIFGWCLFLPACSCSKYLEKMRCCLLRAQPSKNKEVSETLRKQSQTLSI
jgi:hypothetical protein